MKESRRFRILIVVSSISRSGGGVAEAVRLLTKAVAEPTVDIEVMTLADGFYRQDVPNWTPLPVRAFRFFGTSQYGFSPGILFELCEPMPTSRTFTAFGRFLVSRSISGRC